MGDQYLNQILIHYLITLTLSTPSMAESFSTVESSIAESRSRSEYA